METDELGIPIHKEVPDIEVLRAANSARKILTDKIQIIDKELFKDEKPTIEKMIDEYMAMAKRYRNNGLFDFLMLIRRYMNWIEMKDELKMIEIAEKRRIYRNHGVDYSLMDKVEETAEKKLDTRDYEK